MREEMERLISENFESQESEFAVNTMMNRLPLRVIKELR
jgi:hypothetical protein